MLRVHLFGRMTGVAGLAAAACDLTYCLTFAFAPTLGTLLVATAGLFWMLWYPLVGIRLLREARVPGVRPPALTPPHGPGALA